ncbi:MAG: amidohydrolase [Acidimicrobiales bacterium]|nr:amidohydrolase [Hyphomonadaceae bacterium]RZV44226.1 MAG: amidohydrolase [Acidimicrobiales bacterium]
MQKQTSWAALTVSLMIAPVLVLGACGDKEKEVKSSDGDKEIAFPSTYSPPDSQPTLITNAYVLDGIGGEFENANVLIVDGKIAGVGADVSSDAEGLVTIDAQGAWVTPGVIDSHSHLGVYASPSVRAHSDGNEATSPNTAELSSEHGVWPQDPGFSEALAGGVTTLHVLPGSANLFGGKGTTLRNIPSRTVQGMKMPGAPATLKMACGENPKRVYGQKGGPASRMGNFAHYRKHWIKAQGYKKKLDAGELKPGDRNLQLETLAGVLSGDILVQMHCYRADEMAQVLDMAKEFDYKVSSFHHSVEAYKIGDLLKENDTCSAMWADWWGFKMEAYDGIQENIPFVHAQGACALIHSDSGYGIQRLNQEIAKAYGHGKRAGIDISKGEAWKWIAINPAKAIGIDDQTGSLETGKRADVVIWSGDPFSTYTKADKVFLDGALMYDRLAGLKPISDFRLGQPGTGE